MTEMKTTFQIEYNETSDLIQNMTSAEDSDWCFKVSDIL